MTTQTEALKLALEALENLEEHLPFDWAFDELQSLAGKDEYRKDLAKARSLIPVIYEALAQPEQEPVAWLHTKIEGVAVPHRPADLIKHPDRWTALYKDPKPCPTCEALARTVMLDQTSHDTTPPQRTWVGLTDEDLAFMPAFHRVVAKLAEAKLKEKNT